MYAGNRAAGSGSGVPPNPNQPQLISLYDLPSIFQPDLHCFSGSIQSLTPYNSTKELASFVLSQKPANGLVSTLKIEFKGAQWAQEATSNIEVGAEVGLLGKGGKLTCVEQGGVKHYKIQFVLGIFGKVTRKDGKSITLDYDMSKKRKPVNSAPTSLTSITNKQGAQNSAKIVVDALHNPESAVTEPEASDLTNVKVNRNPRPSVVAAVNKRSASDSEPDSEEATYDGMEVGDEATPSPTETIKPKAKANAVVVQPALKKAKQLQTPPNHWPPGLECNSTVLKTTRGFPYKSLKFVYEEWAAASYMGLRMSVIVTAHADGEKPPVKLSSGDWMYTVRALDSTCQVGIDVRMFRGKIEGLPKFENGDALILQNMSIMKGPDGDALVFGPSKQFKFYVLSADDLRQKDTATILSTYQSRPSPSGLNDALVSAAEIDYARELVKLLPNVTLADRARNNPYSRSIGTSRSREPIEIKDMMHGVFAEVVAVLVKVHVHPSKEYTEVYVTDWTEHSEAFQYEEGDHHIPEGPFGKRIMLIKLWSYQRDVYDAKTWIPYRSMLSFSNIKVGYNDACVMEGDIHEDLKFPTKRGVKLVTPSNSSKLSINERIMMTKVIERKKEYELSKAALSDELPLFDVKPEIPMAIPRTPISAPVSVPARNSLGSGSKSNVIQPPGVHCEYLDQGFLPIATVISYDELARTAFHTRGRIIGHEPEAIKDFVQTSCRDCGASITNLMVKCMEDGHERIISHLQVVLTIESDVPGKNGDLASMDVVLNHDSSDVFPGLEIDSTMCEVDSPKYIALKDRLTPIFGSLMYKANGEGPAFDFAVSATRNPENVGKTLPALFQFYGTTFGEA